jgi:hypothetical protein
MGSSNCCHWQTNANDGSAVRRARSCVKPGSLRGQEGAASTQMAWSCQT